MEKKRKKINVKFIVLILSLIIFLSMSVFTFAWFTDSKSFTGNLTFGSLELDVSGGVSGDGVDSATSKLVFDVTRTSGPAYSTTKKVMPGDTININLTLGLKTGSEPAYYLISITDDNGVFDDAYYFSEDGTNIYVFDGEKTYLQSDPNKVNVASKYCGKITTSAKQTIKIGAKVSESYTEQNSVCNVTCSVFAIQQANLEATNAKFEILGRIAGLDTSKYKYVNHLETNGTQYIDTGYIPNENSKFEVKFMVNEDNVKNDCPLFGARKLNMDNSYTFWCHGEGFYVKSTLIFNSCENNVKNFELNVKQTVMLENGKYTINGTTTSFPKVSSGTPNTNLILFGLNDGSIDGRKFYGYVYNFKIYENNVIVRNFVPSIRLSDNKPGMFDTVSGTFYTNAGSGEFLYN